MRILVLIAIALLLYVIVNNLLRKSRSSTPRSITGNMVKCEHCGLHIVEQEALKEGAEFYCSQEHLEAHKQA